MAAESDNGEPQRVFSCQRELLLLIDTLVNVIFCIKAVDGHYLDVNAAFVRRTGKSSKRDVIGTRAADNFVPELAERYEEQDQTVFATGEALRDELELIGRIDGALGWYLTTKFPVGAEDDPTRIVGLVSLSRDLLTPSVEHIAIEGLQNVVRFVHENTGDAIRVADLAAVGGCSEGQLERRMHKVFGLTATQFVIRVRVDHATRLLIDTDEPIAAIATTCGFYDQPDFTRRFARLTNATPAQFRLERRT